MKTILMLFAGLLTALVGAGQAETTDLSVWKFKQEFLAPLVRAVPTILKTQNEVTGRFGSGVWIPADQIVIYPLAAAWAIKDPGNPYYHDSKLLEAIMRGGDVLAREQDQEGKWMFRKKDNSTWGMHFNPWVYSRWVRAYSLIGNAMPPERRTLWQQGLELGYSGIEKNELSRVHNIHAHHAMGLYVAGKALNHPEWCARASGFLAQVAESQDRNGFWSEHLGPVVSYNFVYVDALGIYYGLSRDVRVLPALERAARFHANFTYPDGSEIETVDERNPYLKKWRLPGPGFSFSSEARGYLRRQWHRLQDKEGAETADTVASLLLYGEEGPAVPPPGSSGDSVFLTEDGKASVLRRGAWCASLSAYACPVFSSRWIQDRQNFVSIFHERTGLILGGGNTKLQPLWSTFTVGDTGLLKHRPGDENPDFSQPAGLLYLPSHTSLGTNGHDLALEYGQAACRVSLKFSGPDQARLTCVAKSAGSAGPVEAHLTFVPAVGKSWRTASGTTGRLDEKPLSLTAGQAGAWFEHNGWRVTLPLQSTIVWPVLPHNPYRKDGRAETEEGRIVLTVPFSKDVTTQAIVLIVN